MFDFSNKYLEGCFVTDTFEPVGEINIKCPSSSELDKLLSVPINEMIEELVYDKDKNKVFTEDNRDQLTTDIPYVEKMRLHELILIANNIVSPEDVKKK